MPKAALPLAAGLSRAARRFTQWRETRTTRAIPDPLWSLATRLGTEHGVSRTCRALGVPYHGLRKRVEAAEASSSPSEENGPTTFVEILATPTSATPDCLIEFEDPSGRKMKIHLQGGSAPDLAALSQLFLSQRA